MPRQFGACPDYYFPLEIAKLVADYIGGDFTVFDALEMDQESFDMVFVVASGKGLAEVARAKRPIKKSKE